MSGRKGTIEEVQRSTGQLCFEWRVERFLSLNHLDYFCSPDISFNGASWHMNVYPNNQWLNLGLSRSDEGSPVPLKTAVSVMGSGGEDHREETRVRFPGFSGWKVWDPVSAPKMADLRSGLLQEGTLVLRCKIETDGGGPAMVPQYNGMPPRGMFPTPGMVQGSQGQNPNTQQQLLHRGGARPMTPQGPGAMAQGGGAMPQGMQGRRFDLRSFRSRGTFSNRLATISHPSTSRHYPYPQVFFEANNEVVDTSEKRDAGTQTSFKDSNEVPSQVLESSERKGVEELQKSMGDWLRSGEDSDLVLEVQGREFRAHRSILRARSPVFRAMFAHEMLESQRNAVTIEDCDPESFPAFLEHLYTGGVGMVSASNVCALYAASDKYDLKALKSACVDFASRNLSVASFCDVIALAVRHGDRELTDCASEFYCNHALDIVRTAEWQVFMVENPTVANELYIRQLSK